MKSLDKIRGCLIGGAAGDALGYAVEFDSAEYIFSVYGDKGITEYSLSDGIAKISDDTQMTLFTANGLLLATAKGVLEKCSHYIALCYKDWSKTQGYSKRDIVKGEYAWIANIPELYHRRAPGNTCLSALRQGIGTIDNPNNNSKGCGGVMRVAPVGLYFCDKVYTNEEIAIIGAKVAAITHGHQLGYMPAALLVHVINQISHSSDVSLLDAVEESMLTVKNIFPKAKHLSEFISLIHKAIDLSIGNINDLEAIRQLGEGWVAEETLAIAVYCSLKYSDDFDKAVIASVNHSGDSDSTGSVTGNIMGAYLGLHAIPNKYIDNLELKDVILEIADDVFYAPYQYSNWKSKYIDCDYRM